MRVVFGPSRSMAVILFVCTCVLFGHSQNTIYTVAGGGSVNGSATGPAADLPGPTGVAKDSSGNLYIADPSAQNVFKVDTSGNLSVFAGIGYPTEHATRANGQPANQVGLNGPSSVAVDKSGNVFIADTVNYIIRKVETNGNIYIVAGNTKLCQNPTQSCGDGGTATAAQLNYPVGVATDGAGNVYIADTNDHRIRVLNVGASTITVAGVQIAKGTIATVAGTGAQCANPVAPSCGDGGAALSAQLNFPQGIAVDNAGNIYISDSSDHRVRIVYNATGVINNYAGTGSPCFPAGGCGDGGPATSGNLSNPWQIALDSAGNLFIADAPESRIREVDAATQSINSVAGNGAEGFTGDGGLPISAEINLPRGIAVDTSENLFIADYGNQRVREFTLGGTISTVAGGGSGNDGSVATSAILGADHSVALDSLGNLYIGDTANNRIRKVTPSNPPGSYGTISTIVGTGILGFFGNGRPALQAELSFPYGIVVDSSNNVDIADTGNVVIRQYNQQGTGLISNIAGVPGQPCSTAPSCGDGGPAKSATFVMPTSLALDSGGNLYIADPGNNDIRAVNMGNSTITIAGVTIQPGDIATVAGTGAVCANTAIGSCGDNGAATSALLNAPFGVAVDGLGDVFIADTGDNRIRCVLGAVGGCGDSAHTYTVGTIIAYAFNGNPLIGPFDGPALLSAFEGPYYLATDPHGNLYVSGSDFYYVIERIDALNQYVIPVAGVPTDPKFFGFAGDGGPAIGSNLDQFGVAVDGSGHLYVADGRNNRVREILLTPNASLSTSRLAFPPEPIGTTSPGQSFSLKNGGYDDLYISGTSISGPFALQSSGCANNVVPPGSQCSFTMTSTPTGYGVESGSITITDNGYGSTSQKVNLTGSGPDYSLTASPNSLQVSQGAQGQSTLTLTPIAGFNQTVKLSCSGAPSGATCTVSPKSVTLDGVDPANATLTVQTSSTTPTGTYTLKAVATSATGHNTLISLTVQ